MFTKLSKILVNLFLIVLIFSCSDMTENEEIEDLIYSANNFLNNGNCDDAIDLLEEYGRKTQSASYMMVLSSAYACKSGFTEPSTYTQLVSSSFSTAVGSGTDAAKSQNMINFFVQFETSNMTTPSDDKYTSLQTAIDLLLYAYDITTPSATERINKFGTDDANDINMKLLYMLITQMGQYSYFYGNASNSTGTKGDTNSNGYTNTCYTNYTYADAQTIIGLSGGGACTGNNAGHDLMIAANVGQSTFVTRMCQGVVLMNNFVDVLGNLSFSSSLSSINSAVTAISTTFTTLCNTAMTTYGFSTNICTERSQSQCESNYSTYSGGDAGAETLEVYFASVWETLHQ